MPAIESNSENHNERPSETRSDATSQSIQLMGGKDTELADDDNVGVLVAKKEQVETKRGGTRNKEEEEDVIRKALAFWNHPGLKDVSSGEKRAYLHEQQGLTNAQIHKVWEELVASSGVGREEKSSRVRMEEGNQSNYPFAPSGPNHHGSRQRHVLYHHSNQHPYSLQSTYQHAASNSTYGPTAHSYEAPYTNYDGYSITGNQRNVTGQQQQQQQQQPYRLDDRDGSISVARGMSLLTVGGFLGLTGAAAVRWLNGGSFELLPPPAAAAQATKTESSHIATRRKVALAPDTQQHQQQNDEEERRRDKGQQWNTEQSEDSPENDDDDGYDDEAYEDNDYQDDDDNNKDCTEDYLLERIDALMSSINSNSVLQEKLLLKLANTSSITDQSMSLLKQKNSQSKNNAPTHSTKEEVGQRVSLSRLKDELNEVKGDLESLFETIAKHTSAFGDEQNSNSELDLKNESSKALAKLQTCIQRLEEEKPADSLTKPGMPAEAASAETTPKAPMQLEQHDALLLAAAPSTPMNDSIRENRVDHVSSTVNTARLSLKDCILQIAEKNNPLVLKSGSQLLYLYLANLSGKPDNGRYRKIFVSNESFRKVENLVGGKDLLRAVGFVEEADKGVLEWVPSGHTDEEIEALVLVKEAAAALGILKNANGIPSSQLTESALSKLSSSPSNTMPLPSPPPPPPKELLHDEDDINRDEHREHEDDVLQTPAGSSLLSPPMPKKLPFFPTPSAEDRA